jgi:dihydroxyacetone kinase
MTTNPTRAAAAPRMPEFDQLTIEEDAALVDDVLDRIAASGHPAELDGIVRDMWVDHTNGLLAEAQMEVLDEAARARRKAIQERGQAARREPARRGNAPRPSARPRVPVPMHPRPG